MSARPKLILGAGGAELAVRFVAKPTPPFKGLAELQWNGRGLLAGLDAEILAPFLARWARAPGDRRSEVQASVDEAMERCANAFRACAPERAKNEERAVMAALAVTANLQRTLLYLGEALVQAKRRSAGRGTVVLNRQWCGLVPRPNRSAGSGIASFRPLARALACSPGEIDARCKDALSALRKDFAAEVSRR